MKEEVFGTLENVHEPMMLNGRYTNVAVKMVDRRLSEMHKSRQMNDLDDAGDMCVWRRTSDRTSTGDVWRTEG
jgi:hypothetical protein